MVMIEQESVMSKEVFWVGIDVGSKEVWASVTGLKPRPFAHSASGIKQLQSWLKERSLECPVRFCLEGTGVYSVSVASLLMRVRGTSVSIVNPAQIKAFANAQLRRCKTDRLDAEVIRQFAEANHPPAWEPPTKSQRQLYELVQLRDQICSEIRQWENRRHSRRFLEDVPKLVVQTQQSLLRSLKRQLAKVEAAIKAFVAQDANMAQQVALLTTIPGIAQQSAVQLIAYGQQWLTHKTAKALIAHSGLAPHPRQSGTSLNSRGSLDKRGNQRIRKALYMPTVVAIQHNPIIKDFYSRLITRGKPKMVAMIAAMKKLERRKGAEHGAAIQHDTGT